MQKIENKRIMVKDMKPYVNYTVIKEGISMIIIRDNNGVLHRADSRTETTISYRKLKPVNQNGYITCHLTTKEEKNKIKKA